MPHETIAVRLRHQMGALPPFLAGAGEIAAERRPAPGKWSAREHLAHLARYHQVTGERIARIQREEAPELGRYRAEDDPEWPRWQALPLAAVLAELAARRTALVEQVEALPAGGLDRRCTHALLGTVPLAVYLDFCLVHEGHHLYTAVTLLGPALAR